MSSAPDTNDIGGERIITSERRPGETIDRALRPSGFDEFVGQKELKSNLEIFVQAAKNRGDAMDHLLLFGPPGLGKTTLAQITARELGVNIKTTSGPVIAKAGDHQFRVARRAVHRRNSPPARCCGGNPLSGNGGLRLGPCDWGGAIGALDSD